MITGKATNIFFPSSSSSTVQKFLLAFFSNLTMHNLFSVLSAEILAALASSNFGQGFHPRNKPFPLLLQHLIDVNASWNNLSRRNSVKCILSEHPYLFLCSVDGI